MAEKPAIAEVKMDKLLWPKSRINQSLQIKIDTNKSIVVYNHIQVYILHLK